jgi:hypothetical protein
MGVYKENAKATLVALLNNIQRSTEREKFVKPVVIEDRIDSVIENIIKEVEQRLLAKSYLGIKSNPLILKSKGN